jgi:hypothetical protein
MKDLFGANIKPTATFSDDRVYRYTLTRRWDDRTLCNFLMLNPSTADEHVEDPTVRRCMGFAEAWGYGGLIVTNIFAFRSTDPEALYKVADPVGPGNDYDIIESAKRCALTVCAWGDHGQFMGRGNAVRALLVAAGIAARCLGKNGSGEPQHPLYIPNSRKLIDL